MRKLLSRLTTAGALAVALSSPLAAGSTADLQAFKTESVEPVVAGDDLMYTIFVTNHGPDAAINAEMLDATPVGTTFVSFTGPAGWTLTTPPVGGTGVVEGDNPLFAPGTVFFTLVVRVNDNLPAGSLVTNTATVGSDSTDPQPANDAHTITTAVRRVSDVEASKTASPDPVRAGTDLTYTIVFTNHGPHEAPNAQLLDTVPAGTTFVSFTAPAGWIVTTPPVGGTGNVTADHPAFPPGSASFTLVVRVAASTPHGALIANTATAHSDTDFIHENDSQTVTTRVVGVGVIPTLSPAGALALLVLLGSAATLLLRRRL